MALCSGGCGFRGTVCCSGFIIDLDLGVLFVFFSEVKVRVNVLSSLGLRRSYSVYGGGVCFEMFLVEGLEE